MANPTQLRFQGSHGLDRERYSEYVQLICKLSKLFSSSDTPFVEYRFAESLYVRCHENGVIEDLSRKDNSFDAKNVRNRSGIGIKTFVGLVNQGQYKDEKVAEFTKLAQQENLSSLSDERLAKRVAKLRNKRVKSDAAEFDIRLDTSIYHCLIRHPSGVFIHEEPYPLINEQDIIPTDRFGDRQDNFSKGKSPTVSFTDGENIYKYNRSKNVLYKRFFETRWENSGMIPVTMPGDPFQLLGLLRNEFANPSSELMVLENPSVYVVGGRQQDSRPYVVLPLAGSRYAHTDNPKVEERSGINQWNAGGRTRKFGEAYIPVPAWVRRRFPDFFPVRLNDDKEEGISFTLNLPDRQAVSASLCQENLKGLMSNPNDRLANWLYTLIDGDIHRAEERFVGSQNVRNVPYTYQDLLDIGKDSVVILKNRENSFELKIMPIGAYRLFHKLSENNPHQFPSFTEFEELLNGDSATDL